MNVIINGKLIIDDYTAQLLSRMADKFYANPENIRKFEEWHFQEYGCTPEEKAAKKKRKK